MAELPASPLAHCLSQRSSRRTVLKTVTASMAVGVLFGSQVDPVSAAGETLVVPYVLGTAGIATRRPYAGRLTITASGVGQAAGSQFSDAFYIFTEPDGTPVTPWRLPDGGFTLWINGALADAYVSSIPPYREDHSYSFHIHVKGGRLTFSFGVGDNFVADNSGEFLITIKNGK